VPSTHAVAPSPTRHLPPPRSSTPPSPLGESCSSPARSPVPKSPCVVRVASLPSLHARGTGARSSATSHWPELQTPTIDLPRAGGPPCRGESAAGNPRRCSRKRRVAPTRARRSHRRCSRYPPPGAPTGPRQRSCGCSRSRRFPENARSGWSLACVLWPYAAAESISPPPEI